MIEGIPALKRARDYRLYDQRGRRFLDLYQNGGRALLGHRTEGVTAELKRILDRGLYSPYPSVYANRLKKALKLWLPGYPKIVIYRNRDSLIRSLEKDFKIIDPGRNPGGSLPGERDLQPSHQGISLYRPYTPVPDRLDGLIPVIPFPFSETPWTLCLREDSSRVNLRDEEVSPVFLAGACKAVHSLLNTQERRNVEEWDFLSQHKFLRQGIYFTYLGDEKSYRDLFSRILACGFILDPDYPPVNIIPGEYSPGELKLFRKALEEWK